MSSVASSLQGPGPSGALTLETPVVATDVGGTSELVLHGVHGLIVPRGDAAAITHAVEEVLADPDATRRRAAAARQRVETELSFRSRMRTPRHTLVCFMPSCPSPDARGSAGAGEAGILARSAWWTAPAASPISPA